MPGASLALFADLGACHVQKSSVTICVLPAPFRWRATGTGMSMQTAVQISIHALRVEGDRPRRDPGCRQHPHFYPRPPGGGRLQASISRAQTPRISIHALRVEGDKLTRPRGGILLAFLSTPSGWRATAEQNATLSPPHYFYPRPPSGGRHSPRRSFGRRRNFYPRPPSGGRRTTVC